MMRVILSFLLILETINGYFRGDSLITDLDSAETYCNSFGSNLATITTATEMADAQTECGYTGYSCAIGLYHDDDADDWKWRDGSTDLGFGFDANGDPISGGGFWYTGEPSSDGEDCGHLFSNQNYYVNDMLCDSSYAQYPLCNNDSTIDPTTDPTADPTTDPTSSPTLDGCDFDLSTYLEQCYCEDLQYGLNFGSAHSNHNELSDHNPFEDKYYELLDRYEQISKDKNFMMWSNLASVLTNCVLIFALIAYVWSNRSNGAVEYKQVSLEENQPLN